ncbi:MAG: type IV secretion system DNA-binding domain-containing protein [Ferruginibacter sp.]
MSTITPLGTTNFRNHHQPFGIKDEDRFNHIYVIGKTGTGKSTLLLNMAIADIQRGNGIAVIDPHGDVAERLLDYIPKERITDVIYFNPADTEYTVAFNPLCDISEGQEHLVVTGLMATFRKIWADNWGPRLEYILRYALLTLCHYPGATLLDIQPLLTSYEFRQNVLRCCPDGYIRSFWRDEFDRYSPQLKAEATSPILNKVGLFGAVKILRSIIGQPISAFHIKDVMDEKKILICNLSKGKIGEDAATILGSVLVNAIQLAAIQRAHIPEQERVPFYLYVDEMHSFVSHSFADILAEARKYRLSLFMAHQYIDQVDEKIRAAVFGNVGTMVFFRVGAEDAKQLVQEVHPPFSEADLINLPRYAMYIKLMIDGATSKPFSANTIAIPPVTTSLRDDVVSYSKARFGRIQDDIEKELTVTNNTFVEGSEHGQASLFT